MTFSWGKHHSPGLTLLLLSQLGVLWGRGGDLGLADDAAKRGASSYGNSETPQVLWGGPSSEGPRVAGKLVGGHVKCPFVAIRALWQGPLRRGQAESGHRVHVPLFFVIWTLKVKNPVIWIPGLFKTSCILLQILCELIFVKNISFHKKYIFHTKYLKKLCLCV